MPVSGASTIPISPNRIVILNEAKDLLSAGSKRAHR
jgi:hypothetical protein